MLKLIVSIILSSLFLNNAYALDLKTKIGQMLLIGFKGTELHENDSIVQDILAKRIGGVVLYEVDIVTKEHGRNITTPTQLKQLTSELQHYAKKAEIYPLLIGLDYEGGYLQRLRAKNGFAKTKSAKQIGTETPDEIKQDAEKMAETLNQVGINLNFAPVVDLNINPQNPIIGLKERSFSSDPKKVVADAKIFADIYTKHHILCSYKHFPGHGSSTSDSHLGFVDVSKTWTPAELIPYKKISGCSMVMIAHVVNKQLDKTGAPASLSYEMITNELRRKLHFEGVVITDDLQMGAISKLYPDFNEVLIKAINAGNDILIISNQFTQQNTKELVEMIYQDVKNHQIAESRINEAYQRIVKLKHYVDGASSK